MNSVKVRGVYMWKGGVTPFRIIEISGDVVRYKYKDNKKIYICDESNMLSIGVRVIEPTLKRI